MHLSSGNRTGNDDTPPLRIDVFVVRQQCKRTLDPCSTLVGFGWRKPVAVPVGGTRASIPELHNVLRDIAEPFSAGLESADSTSDQSKLRII
jgi:hypothetical protein